MKKVKKVKGKLTLKKIRDAIKILDKGLPSKEFKHPAFYLLPDRNKQ